MTSKLQTYMEKAESAALRLAEDWRTWTSFLETAGRVYKYVFLEQAMIYAQRPDAIACAEYDLWKKRMRRYVRYKATGIGLVSYKGGEPFVRFVFDVSDTNENEGALYPDLWQYRSEYEPAVTAALESRYQVPARDGLVKQLARIAVRLAEERWDNYQDDILSAAEDSFLEGLDVGLAFRRSAAASIAYAVMSRCGLDPGDYFEPEDFEDLPNFNTVPVITQLGRAVSEASGQVLRQIAAVVKAHRPESGETDRKPPRRAPEGNPAPRAEKPSKTPTSPKARAETPVEPSEGRKPRQNSETGAPEDVSTSSGVPVPGAASQGEAAPPAAQAPSYKIGDSVYLEGTLYQIDAIGLFDVQLLDPSQAYPVLRVESKERFEALLGQDSRNSGLLPQGEAAPARESAPGPAEAPRKPSDTVPEPLENFRITDDGLGKGGPKAKFRANIEAITTLHAIEREGRNATREEQEILSRYVGWGSLADAFDPDKTDWAKEYRELNTVLTPDEYQSAQASVLNAHYTSPAVIRAMYQAVGSMGFKAGNILDESVA